MKSDFENQSKFMRQFHNCIKNDLIQTVAKNFDQIYIRLLDIGVGKGGDIQKWDSAKIDYVIGIDVDKFSIIEARNRFKESNITRDYQFYVTQYNASVAKSLYSLGKHTTMYNIISCQFALHYFFANKYTVTSFFKDIGEKLIPGGYFIGTIVDGESVLELLNNQRNYDNSVIKIQKFFESPKYIGDFIKYSLTGTLYFGENFVSNEYLVFKQTLIEECKNVGLEFISYTKFSDYNFQMKELMSSDSKISSFLNASFIFRKLT
tara:strand:+ start:13429 stop:14217 length:789 start_codon:yes stop_codon:yes gene_type:complete